MNRIFYMAMLLVTWLSFASAYADDVAQIGSETYASLADAIADVPANGTSTTITMLADHVLASGVTVAKNQSIVIDLAGHTVSGTVATSGSHTYLFTNKGTLEITDSSQGGTGRITYVNTTPDTGYSKETCTIYNAGNLTLTEGTIANTTNGGASYAVTTSSNAWGVGDDKETVFNMNGGTLTCPSGDQALRVYQNCADTTTPFSHNTVTISGGRILDTGIFLDNYIHQPKVNTTGEGISTNVTISGGEIHGLIDMNLRHTFHTSLAITGGTFVDSKFRVRKAGGWDSGIPEPTSPVFAISGGQFSFASGNDDKFSLNRGSGTTWTSYQQAYLVSGGVFSLELPTDGGVAYPAGKEVVANTDANTMEAYPWTVGSAAVAQIGETKYASLAEAIAAVPTDGTQKTITMIGDEVINVSGSALTIANNKNVVLELNGHQVVGSCSSGSSSALITNRGTLTIQDNTDTNCDGTGTGKMISGADPIWIHDGSDNYSGSYASNLVTNQGTLVIKSGYFENVSHGSATYAVDNQTSSKDVVLNVEGGKLTAVSCVVRMFCNSTTKQNVVNVSGGRIVTSGYTAIWTQLPGSSSTSKKLATLNITGGEVSGGTYAWYDYSYGDSFEAVNYSISGGNLNGYLYSYPVVKYGTLGGFVTGGTFSVDPSEYVAAGYAAALVEAENVWKVGPVTVTDLKPQGDATETAAKYTATTVVTDENNVKHEVGTNQTVSVAVVEENNVGEDVKLSDFKMNEVVTKAVVAANTEDDIDVQLIVKAAEPVVSDETVTFEVHPEAIITVNNGEPTNVMLTNDDLAQDATFTFVLDVTGRFNNGAAIKVVHKSERPDETFYSTVIDGKVTVSGIKHFSDFELSVVGAVAQIGETEYASLADAFAAVKDGQTITMLIDVVLPAPLNVELAGKAVTLDLGTHTLTGRTNLKSGSLTLTHGNVAGGKQQALNVYGSSEPTEDYSVLTIDNNVNVTADVYGVCLFGATATTKGYGAVVNINGTVTTTGDDASGAVFVSGNLGKNISGDMNNVVNITGKVTSATDAGVALNGNATVNVQNGAQITGNTGIAVKRGTLNVEGGTILGNGANNPNPAANGSGTEMTGAGISMSPTYSNLGSMSVNITGGTVNSSNAQALFKQAGTYQSDATFSVSGGLFSSEVPAEFCAEGYQPKYDEATHKYTVATFEAIWADKDIVLTDGNSYEACVGEPVTQDVVVNSVKYIRNLDRVDCFRPWYVPFDYTLTNQDFDYMTFYRINLIANAEFGDEVQSDDKIFVYLSRMNEGDVLRANRPYVWKAKQEHKGYEFRSDNSPMLYAPVTDSRLQNSTTSYTFDFYGTYSGVSLQNGNGVYYYYVDSDGYMGRPVNKAIPLGPYRWYIKSQSKGTGAYYAPTFVFTDDSDVTGIENGVEVKTVDCYYDLKGMKIEKPGKGAYLVKFKDGTVKKVVK